MLTSIATIPSQPNEALYPISALYEYPYPLARDSFKALTGQQAPPFDPTQGLKRWFATDTNTFNVFDLPSESFKTILLSNAAAVNLPGVYVWPNYVPPRTTATYAFTSSSFLFNAALLSRLSDANAVAAEIPGAFVSINTSIALSYSDEEAKRYDITINGVAHPAGTLVSQRYFYGIGHPGSWNSNFTAWVPAPDVTDPVDGTPAEIPCPCRPLLANEKIYPSMMPGAMPLISRTDMNTTNPGGGGGGFTEADRTMLQEVHEWLKAATGH